MNISCIPPEWHILKKYAKYIYRVLGFRAIKMYLQLCNLVVVLLPEYLQDSFFFLTKNSIMNLTNLCDIVVKDTPGFLHRFFLTYILSSKDINLQLQVSCFLKDFEIVKSISNLYSSAKWFENEAWEFFGICFLNSGGEFKHRRLLTDYGFSGYPLRKDFPLMGFFELIYSPAYGLFESKVQGKTLFLESRTLSVNYTHLNI